MRKSITLLTLALMAIVAILVAGCGGGGGGATPASVSITTSTVPSGIMAVSYNQTLTATGGTAPYTWTVSSGALPTGLTLSSAGVISGTPTASGTFNFTAKVTDSSSPQLTASVSLTMTVAVMGITPSTLPAATVGTAYNQTLNVTGGGTSPFTWSLATGSSLPAGLTMSSTGIISGTPTAAGTTTFTVMVTDSATPTANTATMQYSLVVNAAGAPLAISTTTLPAGTVGTAYSQTLAATGGTTPYTWSLATGSTLPAGLTLSAAGVISGTPTTAATTSFTVMVTDSATTPASVSQALSITISSSGPAVPAQPTGVTATPGTNSITITWPAVTGATSYNIYWSATTGVTTTNGTKITGVTSPYRHSRLTTTPTITWLAANTPYFYIVTAVNAAGESLPSAQATATTSAVDGVNLYTLNCDSCHNPLATSAKTGRTAAQIQAAINGNVGGMGFLSTLTPAQVQAIADVLVAGF